LQALMNATRAPIRFNEIQVCECQFPEPLDHDRQDGDTR
jgi:hypothetical protein